MRSSSRWILISAFLFYNVVMFKFFINFSSSSNWEEKKKMKSFNPSSFFDSKYVENVEELIDKVDSKVLKKIKELTQCKDKSLVRKLEQRGDYYVLYNYVVANMKFRCHESVTYTTQGDVNFLDNLIPLIERWEGPVSVSIYSPGSDFFLVVDGIAYLRSCTTPLIRNLVTFHLFFESKFTPHFLRKPILEDKIPPNFDDFDCSKSPPYLSKKQDRQFKSRFNLTYPINVGRNSAKNAAQTYFVLASDIELYPSINIIPNFLNMIANSKYSIGNKEVFVLPHFEIVENSEIPSNKTTLVEMIRNKRAFFFHEHICKPCHRIPNYPKWLDRKETKNFHVFAETKRMGSYRMWEPFYVGTKDDPFFDERLSWEGQKNKMTQNYIMCLLNYDYKVLDNAFLVHRPGIKMSKEQITKHSDKVSKTANLIRNYIKPEIDAIYGWRRHCVLR